MTTTLLDARSRPTTDAERAKAYAKPNPVADEHFTMIGYPAECGECSETIPILSFAWLRDVSADEGLEELAKTDPTYVEGTPIFVPHCEVCAHEHFDAALADFNNEQLQREREEQLEEACAREAAGDMGPEEWITIIEANFGYVDQAGYNEFVHGAVGDYDERFKPGAGDEPVRTQVLERVRTRLWNMVPKGHGPIIGFEPEGRMTLDIDPTDDDPALAEMTMRCRVRMVVR